jgi:AcrR family transcriptional regulator
MATGKSAAERAISSRRVGAATSKTRLLLLDRTERLLLQQGYAAVSYRALAVSAGVTAGLVQYYFPTLDDLFIAVVRRRTQQALDAIADGLRAGPPLRALWKYASDRTGAALTAELMALANHRKVIRTELAEAGERIRGLVIEALSATTADYELSREKISPEVLVFLMTSIPRMIVMEAAVGMSTSHDATTEAVERYLDRVEPRQPDGGPAGPEAATESA